MGSKREQLAHRRKRRIRYTVGVILFLLIIVWPTAIRITDIIKENKAKQAAILSEQKRLAHINADPITVAGIYNALNKERSSTGASALTTVTNLSTAATQYCNDMTSHKYFAYKNPTTGKDANSFITDNAGDLYLKTFVSSIFSANNKTQTATDAVLAAVKYQATNLNNPQFNSVGWAICQPPDNPDTVYVVGSFADVEDKPQTNTVYKTVPSYTPTYTAPTHCYTTYNDYGGYFNPTATTSCY